MGKGMGKSGDGGGRDKGKVEMDRDKRCKWTRERWRLIGMRQKAMVEMDRDKKDVDKKDEMGSDRNEKEKVDMVDVKKDMDKGMVELDRE